MDITCKHCGRYLFKQAGTVVIEGLICPNSSCKAKLNFKIVTADRAKDVKHVFTSSETPPKSKEPEVS